jgi:hypothetical protein
MAAGNARTGQPFRHELRTATAGAGDQEVDHTSPMNRRTRARLTATNLASSDDSNGSCTSLSGHLMAHPPATRKTVKPLR